MTDEQHLPVEVNGRYHAVFVAAEIEHVKIANLIDRSEYRFQRCETWIRFRFDRFAPQLQWFGCLDMRCRECERGFVRDDSHLSNYISK